ncbi:hypothetical protein F5B21DRAFT_473834 [Xylaria acuta]|nr:hypothetical protein F5B21DRAFT_473834 [Xylaria acuta]
MEGRFRPGKLKVWFSKRLVAAAVNGDVPENINALAAGADDLCGSSASCSVGSGPGRPRPVAVGAVRTPGAGAVDKIEGGVSPKVKTLSVGAAVGVLGRTLLGRALPGKVNVADMRTPGVVGTPAARAVDRMEVDVSGTVETLAAVGAVGAARGAGPENVESKVVSTLVRSSITGSDAKKGGGRAGVDSAGRPDESKLGSVGALVLVGVVMRAVKEGTR